MPLVMTGRDKITQFVAGTAGTSQGLYGARAFLHIADGAPTFSFSRETVSTSAANWFAMPMDGGYPATSAANRVFWQGTAASSEALFAWNEWMIKNSSMSSSGAGWALNHVIQAFGTHSAGVWTLQAQVDFAGSS